MPSDLSSHLLSQPPQRPLIFPSILGADFMAMREDLASVIALGADGLHVDIMDGHFVPNLTMGPLLVEQLRRDFPSVYLDVHLMVTDPTDFVTPFANAGADCLTFHIETTQDQPVHHPRALIDQIRQTGCQAGIVVNPPTPITSIESVIDEVDMVLIMSVNPGFSGQSFMPEVLDKVRWLKERLPATTRIEMDGGVGPETAEACRDAGCDVMVTASALFNADDRAAVLTAMRG